MSPPDSPPEPCAVAGLVCGPTTRLLDAVDRVIAARRDRRDGGADRRAHHPGLLSLRAERLAGVGQGHPAPRASSWVVLLSIPLAFRFNAHVGMDFDLTKLGICQRRRCCNRFNAVFMLILFGLTAFYATQLAAEDLGSDDAGPRSASVGLFLRRALRSARSTAACMSAGF